jgi:hypothetical protein
MFKGAPLAIGQADTLASAPLATPLHLWISFTSEGEQKGIHYCQRKVLRSPRTPVLVTRISQVMPLVLKENNDWRSGTHHALCIANNV